MRRETIEKCVLAIDEITKNNFGGNIYIEVQNKVRDILREDGFKELDPEMERQAMENLWKQAE